VSDPTNPRCLPTDKVLAERLGLSTKEFQRYRLQNLVSFRRPPRPGATESLSPASSATGYGKASSRTVASSPKRSGSSAANGRAVRLPWCIADPDMTFRTENNEEACRPPRRHIDASYRPCCGQNGLPDRRLGRLLLQERRKARVLRALGSQGSPTLQPRSREELLLDRANGKRRRQRVRSDARIRRQAGPPV
jgi:hypothetical protein